MYYKLTYSDWRRGLTECAAEITFVCDILELSGVSVDDLTEAQVRGKVIACIGQQKNAGLQAQFFQNTTSFAIKTNYGLMFGWQLKPPRNHIFFVGLSYEAPVTVSISVATQRKLQGRWRHSNKRPKLFKKLLEAYVREVTQ